MEPDRNTWNITPERLEPKPGLSGKLRPDYSYKMLICFIDSDGKVILEKKLTSLPLREETIIAKSIEFFSDPEPCMIHRSAVMKRLYIEINEYMSEALQRGEKQLVWRYLPAAIKTYICAPNDIEAIAIKKI